MMLKLNFLKNTDVQFDYRYFVTLVFASVIRLTTSIVIVFIILYVNTQKQWWFSLSLLFSSIAFYAFFYYRIHTKTNKVIDQMIFSLRMRVARKITNINFVHWSTFEKSSFIDAFIKNLTVISQNRNFIKKLIITTSYGLAGIFFLAWFSFLTFVVFVSTTLIFVYFYIFSLEKMQIQSTHQQKLEEKQLSYFESTLSGFKQIKMHKKRSQELLGETIHCAEELAQKKIELNTIQDTQTTALRTFIYLILAVIAFPPFEVTQQDRIALLIITISFVGPFIWAVFGFIPNITKFFVALNNIYIMEEKIDFLAENSPDESQESLLFSEIQLRDIVFSYPDKNFTLGPLSLSFQKGTIVFIVGDNGCGKSTLGKIILGLLSSNEGDILLNKDITICKENITAYRSIFSPVFVDFHLFSKLYGVKNEDFYKYLQEMELEQKISLDEDQLCGLDLSTGQKKRLAFIISLLENNQIYLFDEPASDQDPRFKEYFYKEFVSQLISNGKTVIVISHDEEYFEVADQVIHINDGKIVLEK
ncbi:ATP-binding cassette domain-containing protein [Candidatus Uabimicrobium sp. HlEnr_7]|uniref:ATP-binding cassette domain-containing protein n=1 Tax=Candidatus Uabimicrobium helgolandensis TaxID=3095367 RepID=UPI003556A974